MHASPNGLLRLVTKRPVNSQAAYCVKKLFTYQRAEKYVPPAGNIKGQRLPDDSKRKKTESKHLLSAWKEKISIVF